MFFLCSVQHHTMKTCGLADAQLHSFLSFEGFRSGVSEDSLLAEYEGKSSTQFLTSAPDRDQRSDSRPGRLPTGIHPTVLECIGEWAGPGPASFNYNYTREVRSSGLLRSL
jgi:hypothetical protein